MQGVQGRSGHDQGRNLRSLTFGAAKDYNQHGDKTRNGHPKLSRRELTLSVDLVHNDSPFLINPLFDIADIVFAIFHAPLEPVRALDDAVVLIHAFLELFELVIHERLCGFCAAASGREGADQRDAAGNQGYDDGFCHSGVYLSFF